MKDFIKNILSSEDMIADCKENIRFGLQGIILKSLTDVFFEEVENLCGPKHYPNKSKSGRRSGSSRGKVYFDGQQHDVVRPRVRQGNKEVLLDSYKNAKGSDQMVADIFRAYSMGVSTREMRHLHPKSSGFSKSNVNRKWVANSVRYLDELRGRDIASHSYLAMMIDGIHLSEELTALIALGITGEGDKVMLDFTLGGSENQSLCSELLLRISHRGFRFGGTPFFILDGSKALDQAVRKQYGNALIQRCLVHKENNLRGYLSRKDYPELSRLMKILRKSQGIKAGREALQNLRKFISQKNQLALESLDEAGDDLITLHSLNVPATLNISLLSTNCIENTIKNFRRKTARVTRWRLNSDMPQRWMAYAMICVEQGFRKIKGYKDINKLKKALKWREMKAAA